MKMLTKAEEQVMQVLWKLHKSFLRDIVDAMPSPRPHQNTVATLLKILVEKQFAGINVLGRQHEYYPLISKEDYSRRTIRQMVKGYFEGSFSNIVSFMVKENNISVEEVETLLQQIKKQQNAKKNEIAVRNLPEGSLKFNAARKAAKLEVLDPGYYRILQIPH